MAGTADMIETLAAIPDPQERLAWIVQHGRQNKPLSPEQRVPTNRVPGCVSAVWLIDESDMEVCRFRGDAEAPVLRGVVSLICAEASERPIADVANSETDLISKLRLERHLTPTRLEGTRKLQDHIRTCAIRHLASTS